MRDCISVCAEMIKHKLKSLVRVVKNVAESTAPVPAARGSCLAINQLTVTSDVLRLLSMDALSSPMVLTLPYAALKEADAPAASRTSANLTVMEPMNAPR